MRKVKRSVQDKVRTLSSRPGYSYQSGQASFCLWCQNLPCPTRWHNSGLPLRPEAVRYLPREWNPWLSVTILHRPLLHLSLGFFYPCFLRNPISLHTAIVGRFSWYPDTQRLLDISHIPMLCWFTTNRNESDPPRAVLSAFYCTQEEAWSRTKM